eukprot:m.36358 g.36358  ORF g.36358 m.36358 type:complete len:50 (-) comp9094_c0_seq4:540-689(-)
MSSFTLEVNKVHVPILRNNTHNNTNMNVGALFLCAEAGAVQFDPWESPS